MNIFINKIKEVSKFNENLSMIIFNTGKDLSLMV